MFAYSRRYISAIFFTFRRNSTDKQSIRITDFLELTGFLERFCGTTERETYAYCDSIEEADYNKTSEALQVMRQQSIEYLICNTNVTKKIVNRQISVKLNRHIN